MDWSRRLARPLCPRRPGNTTLVLAPPIPVSAASSTSKVTRKKQRGARSSSALTVSFATIAVVEFHGTSTDTTKTQARLARRTLDHRSIDGRKAGFVESVVAFGDDVRFLSRKFETEAQRLEAHRAVLFVVARVAAGDDSLHVIPLVGVGVLIRRGGRIRCSRRVPAGRWGRDIWSGRRGRRAAPARRLEVFFLYFIHHQSRRPRIDEVDPVCLVEYCA